MPNRQRFMEEFVFHIAEAALIIHSWRIIRAEMEQLLCGLSPLGLELEFS